MCIYLETGSLWFVICDLQWGHTFGPCPNMTVIFIIQPQAGTQEDFHIKVINLRKSHKKPQNCSDC